MGNEVKRESISTLNDLMDQIQQEIQDVKTGTLAESTARVVLGGRKAQLKAAEIGIQYARMMKPKNPTLDGEVPLLPGRTSSTPGIAA